MKSLILPIAILAALTFAGCSKKEATTAAAGSQSGVRTIQITGNDAMKYSVTAIEAKVGEEIKIVLTNIGTMPKQAMGHNLVVLKPGSDGEAFSKAAAQAMATEYIPASLAGEVIAHTKLLGPKESESLTLKFDAPGVYPYVCSFPAHYQIGMKGTITVK